MSSGQVYVIDEYQAAALEKQIKAAKTLDDLKKVLLELLKELPTSYVS